MCVYLVVQPRCIYVFVYLHLACTIDNAHSHTTGKCKAGSFQVQRQHILSKLCRHFEPQNSCSLATTHHPCTWMMSMPDELLYVWTSPQETTTTLCILYGESYALIYNGHVALPYQFIERAIFTSLWSTAMKCTTVYAGHVPTTSGIAPARPNCLALH